MNSYPLIKFVILFVLGIAIQSIFHFTFLTIIISLVLTFAFFIIIYFKQIEKLEVYQIISAFFAVIFLGSFYYLNMASPKVIYPFPLEKYSNSIIKGTIDEIMLSREDKLLFNLKTDSIITKDFKTKIKLKVLCNINDNRNSIAKLYNNLGIGNTISINGNFFRPRNERNPSEYDYEKYLNDNGITCIVHVYKSDDLIIISDKVSFRNVIHIIRKAIDEKISLINNKTTSGLLRGLLLADRSAIDYETRNEFVNAGVIHVLAVSGLHVGYIVLIFSLLFNRFNIYLKFSFTVIGLLFFLIITGMPASVFRAVVMSIVLILGQVFNRDYNGLNSISLAAFIILLLKPDELFNAGFQLSFSAVLSIIIIYPKLSAVINSWKIKSTSLKWILLFFSVSLSAQIGTLPFTLVYFNKLSIIALLANIVVIPVIGIIVGLGIFSIVTGVISLSIASIFSSTNELLTFCLFSIVKIMGGDNYSYLSINQFSIYDAVIFYITLSLTFLMMKYFIHNKAILIAFVLSVLLMVILMRIDNYEIMTDNKLSVMFIDVGQGDSFLIKFPNSKTALIDAGDATNSFDNGERVILPLLNKLGINQIDYGFISHVDSDHYKGFLSLIDKNKIKLIYKPKLDAQHPKDVELEKYLRLKHIRLKYYSKEIISIGNCRIYVLNDTTNNYFCSLNSNDKSGLLKFVYGKSSFLFTGDASSNVESFYVKYFKNILQSDVIKAGHHGSKTSTSELLLNTVKPKFAIISAGVMNKFNHPNKETLNKFGKFGVNVLRTDKSGAILLCSDGFAINNINWKAKESTFNY